MDGSALQVFKNASFEFKIRISQCDVSFMIRDPLLSRISDKKDMIFDVVHIVCAPLVSLSAFVEVMNEQQ